MSDKKNDETKEEKKEGKLSGFFKKVSQKFDDATREMRMHADFNDRHPHYTVYRGTSLLQSSPEIAVEEHLDAGYLITIDDDEAIAVDSLIENNQTGEVVHIVGVDKTQLDVEFEGAVITVDALKISLGDPAVKVDVIKVGNEFYLK